MAGRYILYEHRNKVNGKRYIGVTNNKTKRWYGKGKHYDGSPYFWAAIQVILTDFVGNTLTQWRYNNAG